MIGGREGDRQGVQKVKMVMISCKSNDLRSEGSCLDSLLPHKAVLSRQAGLTDLGKAQWKTPPRPRVPNFPPSLTRLYCPAPAPPRPQGPQVLTAAISFSRENVRGSLAATAGSTMQ